MTVNRRAMKPAGFDAADLDWSLPEAASTPLAASRRALAALRTYSWEEIASRFDAIARRDRDDRVIFYRHGATNYNRRNLVSGQHNTQLSDEGRRQAVLLSADLPSHIDLIVCSALDRSIETMRLSVPHAVVAHVPVLLDPRLNEVNLGVLQGRRRRHLAQFDAGDIDFAPQEGESYRDAAHRVLSVIVDIFDALAANGAPPRNAVVFCHAGVLRIIATLTRGGDDPKDVFRNSLGNAECLAIDAGEVRLPGYWKERHADLKERAR